MSLEAEQIIKNALDGTFIQWAVQSQCFVKRKVPLNFTGDYSRMKVCDVQKLTNPTNKWTDDEINQLIALKEAGMGLDLISRHLGRTVAACRFRYAESTRDSNRKRRWGSKPWDGNDSDLLIDLAAQGLSAGEIGAKMGRDEGTIRKWSKAMGVTIRRLRKMQLRYLKKAA